MIDVNNRPVADEFEHFLKTSVTAARRVKLRLPLPGYKRHLPNLLLNWHLSRRSLAFWYM